ncbi:hypothetical protein GCM10027610_081050 [Dactylosporangium cerinum]
MSRSNEPDRETVAAVLAFVDASDAAETEAVLRQHHELLLTDQADRVLSDLIRQYRDETDDVTALRRSRRLLYRCREYGIDRGLVRPDRRPEVEAAVLDLVNIRDMATLRRHVADHLELLVGPEAAAVLDDLRLLHLDQEDVQELLRDRRRRVESAVSVGPEQAFSDQILDVPHELVEAVGRLLDTPFHLLRGQIERRAGMLLSDKAEEFINFTIDNFTIDEADGSERSDDFIARLRQIRTVLQACRANGLDAVLGPPASDRSANSDGPDLRAEATAALASLANERGTIAANDMQLLIDRRPELAGILTRPLVTEQVWWTGLLGVDATHSSLHDIGQAYAAGDWGRAFELSLAAIEAVDRARFPSAWGGLLCLAGTAIGRQESGDRAANLDRAIEYHTRARSILTPADGVFWRQNEHHLAVAYQQRGRGSRWENHEMAIEILRNLIAVVDPAEAEPEWHGSLAELLRQRVIGDSEENLREATAHLELILSRPAADNDASWRPTALVVLGLIHLNRGSGDRADNVERAIDLLTRGVAGTEPGLDQADWATPRRALASAYLARVHGDKAENWQAALDLLAEVVDACPKEQYPEIWAENQLGTVELLDNAPGGVTTEHLRRMAEITESVLTVYTLRDFPHSWAQAQTILGSIYASLASEDDAYIDRAVSHLTEAFQIYTREGAPARWAHLHRTLARVYTRRAERAEAERRWPLRAQAVQHLERVLEVCTVAADPLGRLKALNHLAMLHFRHQRWYDALRWLVTAMRVIDSMLATAHTPTGQLSAVATDVDIYACAAYCLVRLNDPFAAMICAEWGKGRLLAHALVLRDLDLLGLPTPKMQEIRSARHLVRQLDASLRHELSTGIPEAVRTSQRLAAARRTLDVSLADVETDHADAVRHRLRLDEVGETVPVNGAVIMPTVTPEGTVILALVRDDKGQLGLITGSMSWVTNDVLRGLLHGGDGHPGWMSQYQMWRMRALPDDAWRESIRANLRLLWQALVEPMAMQLEGHLPEGATVTIVPQGALSFLPLHAAGALGDGTGCLLDRYVVSYAPSIYALRASKRRLAARAGSDIDLLAVVDPTGDLEFARVEGDLVRAAANGQPQTELSGATATAQRVTEAVAGRTHVHFCCHGGYDPQDVLRSGLRLAGSALTLERILDPAFDLTANRLVVLSACETGLVDLRSSADEFIGLPPRSCRAALVAWSAPSGRWRTGRRACSWGASTSTTCASRWRPRPLCGSRSCGSAM